MKKFQKELDSKKIEIIYDDSSIDQNIIRMLKIDFIELSDHLKQIGDLHVKDQMVFFSEQFKQFSEFIFEIAHTLKLDGEPLLAFHLADYYFNHFSALWRQFIEKGLHIIAANLWIKLCIIVWDWEAKRNSSIHKGTPYAFLGRTLITLGDLDSGFLFIFNAIEEDKRTSKEISMPDRYKQVPAYMFATLVNDSRNLLFDYVQQMIKEIQRLIIKYNSVGGTLQYGDFEQKFLHNADFEEISFFFVYNLMLLLRQRRLTRSEIMQNEFSKLKNLDTIFNLCLIVDKVLEKKFQLDSIGKNIHNFCQSKNWITEKDAKEFKKNLKPDLDLDKDPNYVVKPLLNNTAKYKGNSMNVLMSAMILVWYLRNYGGHRIEGQNVLVEKFMDIIEMIFNTLFMAVEEL